MRTEELVQTTKVGKKDIIETSEMETRTLEDTTAEGRDELLETTTSGRNELIVTSEMKTRKLVDTTAAGRDELFETTMTGRNKLIVTSEMETRKLKDTTADGLEELFDTTMSGRNKLIVTSEMETRKLVDSTADGRKELLQTTKVVKKEIIEKGAVEARKHEDTTADGLEELLETTMSGRNELIVTSEMEKSKLEDTTADGNEELLQTTMVGKKELIVTSEIETRKLKDTTAAGRDELFETTMTERNKLIVTSEMETRKLKDTTADGQEELLDTTMSGRNKLIVTSEMETRKLVDSTADGRKELLQTTKVVKKEIIEKGAVEARKLEDVFEKGKLEIDKIIENQRPKIEKSAENMAKAKSGLKAQLIEHYKPYTSHLTVRLDIDETIENIYENPRLTLIKIENGKTTEADISEGSQLFSTSDGTIAKKIIVEGEPGKGKSSLCKKIVHDWCKVNENVEKEPVASNVRQFEFLFYIILREVQTESEIKNMIVQHILKKIDSDYENEHSLLGEILKSEHCLLLLDGLDEWQGQMPHVETCWRNCTTLITTRPYKLAVLKVSPTQIGKHVKLDGVQNPDKLVSSVIRKLEEIHEANKDPESCIQELKDKKLWHLSENPVVLVHIVWLWQRSKLRKNMSRSTLYQKIFDERWYEMCGKKETDIDPQELFDVLSEIAFEKLLSKNEDKSLVFNIKGKQLEKFKQFKEASLESGIMSASNVPGERFPQYQFLHKTFQEYLAAVFLSKRGSELSSSCNIVKDIHSNHRKESVFALEQVFLFLCGLSPVAAEGFSKTLNELFTENCENIGRKYMSLQDMIFRGYDEAEKNEHVGADLCLQHVVLEFYVQLTENQRSKLKLCFDDRKSSLVSLCINGEKALSSTLQNKDDPTLLDLLSFKNLKFVVLDDVPFEDINLNLNGLLQCEIQFRDFKKASKLISSLQCSDLSCLKTLTLENVGFECETMDILSKIKNVERLNLTWSKSSRQNDSQSDPVDLRHLKYLKNLAFTEHPFSDVVNLQLHKLQQLNIGFRTQQRAPKLMAALLQGNDTITTVPNAPHFFPKQLQLKNVRLSAEVYWRFVSVALQSGHSVDFTLDRCTIEEDITQEQEEMGNQPALQVVIPQAASTDYHRCITLRRMTVSAKVFRRLVSVALQSGHSVGFTLFKCTIEEDITQEQEEMGNQSALQVVIPQAASTDYQTCITLHHMTVSAKVFRRLVSVALQSGHSVNFTLFECSIEENITQEEMGNQPALQVVIPQVASTDYQTCITLHHMTVSAKVFSHLVSVALQSGHSVDFTLILCTIEEEITQEQEEMGNQSALQVVTPQATSTEYKTGIDLSNMIVSAKVLRRLVCFALQPVHHVDFTLQKCKIEEDITQVQEEMGNQSALQVVIPQAASTDYQTCITLHDMTVSAKVLRRLVRIVIQSRHTVECQLECTIKPDDEVSQLQVEMENQSAIKVIEFSRRESGWYITFKANV